jgi:hypothetical protein
MHPSADGKRSTLIPAPGVGVVDAIKWPLQGRYMQIERMAELTPPLIDADPGKLPPWRRDHWPPQTPPRFRPA